MTPYLSCPLGRDGLAFASSLRAIGTEFTVHVFKDLTLPVKGQALDTLVGWLSDPSFYFRKDNVLNISISATNSCFFLIFLSSEKHLGLTFSTKLRASLSSLSLVIFLSLS